MQRPTSITYIRSTVRSTEYGTECEVLILTCICIRSPLFARLPRLLGRDKSPLPGDPPVTRCCVSKKRRSLHRLLYYVQIVHGLFEPVRGMISFFPFPHSYHSMWRSLQALGVKDPCMGLTAAMVFGHGYLHHGRL